MRISHLSEEAVDCLVYILCGVSPDTKVADMGCSTKGEIRENLRCQFMVKSRKKPNRLAVLGDELDNLHIVAARLGYSMALFTPNTRQILAMLAVGSPSTGSQLNAKSIMNGNLALENGNLALENGDGASTVSGTSELPEGNKEPGTSELIDKANAQTSLVSASWALPPLNIPSKFAHHSHKPKAEVSSSDDKTVPEALQGMYPLTAGGSAAGSSADNVVDVAASETKQETPALSDSDSAFMLGQLG